MIIYPLITHISNFSGYMHYVVSYHLIQFQNVPDERRNESGAKKIWTFAELLYGISFPYYVFIIKRSGCAYDIQVYITFDKFNY